MEISINKNNINAFELAGTNKGNVIGDKGNTLATVTTKKEGKNWLCMIATPTGKSVNVKFSTTEDKNGNTTFSGNVDGSPTSLTVNSAGIILHSNPPTVPIDPEISAIAKTVKDSIDNVLKPHHNSFVEKKIETGTVQPIPVNPFSFGSESCHLAIIACGIAAIEGGPIGGFVGGFIAGLECFKP